MNDFERFGGRGSFGWGHPIDPPAVQTAKRAVEQAESALEQAMVSPTEQAAEQSVAAAKLLYQNTIAALTAGQPAPTGAPTAQVAAVQTALAGLKAAQATPATPAPAAVAT